MNAPLDHFSLGGSCPRRDPSPARVLFLTNRCVQALQEWAQAQFPHEAVGLLLGDADSRRVRRIRNMTNVHERPEVAYALDPEQLLQAFQEVTSSEEEVLGIWHSHPNGSQFPSSVDQAHAWEGWSYVIVAVRSDGANTLSSWRKVGESFCQEELQIE